ncbi:hypothetical protein [Arthrobacter humicola]|uniref:hypothetical protein n=1 Tax=Arthrobacter humicola TaxID=409291 RepID=UPI001FAB3A74|nr:hypothetical protein [Arthrobacter humicola]MCI9870431.1 hypothetical protein [Arthrobacter humicola]
MMPIVKNAIQAVVPRNIIAIATATKTIRSAGKPRPCFSSLSFAVHQAEATSAEGDPQRSREDNLPRLITSTVLTRPENRPTVSVIDRL